MPLVGEPLVGVVVDLVACRKSNRSPWSGGLVVGQSLGSKGSLCCSRGPVHRGDCTWRVLERLKVGIASFGSRFT
jgi:hypothetical protein